MKQEDEAIISASNSVVQSQSQQQQQKQGRGGNERALQKPSWMSQGAEASKIAALEELDSANDSKPFNQFEGKKTNYSDDIYSTKLDYSNVSEEKKQHALKVEREIERASTKNRHMAEERN